MRAFTSSVAYILRQLRTKPMPSPRHRFLTTVSATCLSAVCLVSSSLHAQQSFPADQVEFFEKNVRPILVENCQSCHGAEKQKNGLRLDSRDAVLKGSEYNKVVIPGDPENSPLIKAVRHVVGTEPMPSKKPQLAANQIDALAQWIKMGAPWGKDVQASSGKPKWEQHWAYLPVKKPVVPRIQNAKLKIQNEVDGFVAAKLDGAGLDFAPASDRATLARRLHLDLTGLLPTYDELQAFVNDKSPDATQKLINRLLESPHYGERWARHWMDVARYSDTDGYHAGGVDNRYPYAYTYREWIIKSLNSDMPYDEFLTMQLAADKVVAADPTKSSKNLAALGFLTVGDYFLGDTALQTDDRIDVVSRGMLGITIGCARCHDHKYDPIKSKDYYSLYSVFSSSNVPEEKPIIGESTDKTAVAEFKRKSGEIEVKMKEFREEVYGDIRKTDRLRDYLMFAQDHLDAQDTAFRGDAGKQKLRDRFASKWRDFLKRHALNAKPNPVMVAWKEFSALPPKDFEKRAEEIAQRLAKPEGGVNPVLRNELAKRPAPKAMTDVAAMYADVFLTCIAGQEPNNADWQQVRQILLDPASPMSVAVDDVDRFFTRKDTEHMTQFRNQLKKLEITEPGAPQRAMVMEDTPKPRDVRVFIRGNPARQGEPAPRAFPAFLGGQQFTQGSGRLELAKAITSKGNPLTARVIVNRVWMEHFGKPLVAQPSDFGVQSPKPEQAELLDYLAATFMEQGWSLKKLHRLILNSRTYQQSCASTPEKELKDPEDNLLSRMNRRRMDYETMRDSMLQVSRSLDGARMGSRAIPLNTPDVDTFRTIYLFVDRYEQATVPAMFDFANPDSHSPSRFVTTVPQQTLFLMNSPFIRTQAEKLAAKLPIEGSTVDARTIKTLYNQVLLRNPKLEEADLAKRFLNDSQTLQQDGAVVWHYGSANVTKDEKGAVKVSDFTEFTNFAKYGNGYRWAHSEKIPDPKWHYCFWGSTGGHAGEGDLAPTAQWKSTFDGEIRISGKLKRPNERGNGVHGWVVNSRTGGLFDVHVDAKGVADMVVQKTMVKKGDIITFAVTSEHETDSDSFEWVPVIERLEGGGRALVTNGQTDFCGPDHWPMGRSRPQNSLSQLVQVLMMSNEFQFID